MRLFTTAIAFALTATAAQAEECKLSPKEVVSQFMDEFYIQKKVRSSFEKWVDPGYIQHNPFAATGRDAAIAFLEPFVANNPTQKTKIHRVIADGNIVAVHSHGWNETGDAAAKTAHMRFPGSVTLPPDVFSGLVVHV